VFFTFILLFNNTDPSASEEEEEEKGFSAFYKMTKIGEVAISKARKY
jgi:hypothetical protein